MTITMRKTYRVLHSSVRDTLREELQSVRAAEGCLTMPRVAAMALELQVAERTVWRLAETHDADDRCPARTPFILGPVHRKAIAASPNLKAAWRELRDNGVSVPGYVQWTRAVRADDPAIIAGLRYGREALHEKQAYMLVEAGARNETWSIDHYYVPVQVRWPGYANPVTPVQTTLMDEKARIVLAAVLWPKPPTAEQALSVVAKAMHGFTTADGVFVGGRPGTLRMDNGAELIGEVMTEGLINLRVTPTPARARGAWEKGKLERWHETLGLECWSMEAGWTGGPRNYEGRPILTAAPNSLPDDATVRQHLAEWVVHYNTERSHAGLDNRTPLQVWATDPTPVQPSRDALLRTAMLTVTRKVRKEGVRVSDLPFTNPVLTQHRDRILTVAYLPEEETFVDVELPDGSWVRAVRHDAITPAQAKELMRIRSVQERTVTRLTGSARDLRSQRSADRAASDQTRAEQAARDAAAAAELSTVAEEPEADGAPVEAELGPSTPAGDKARRKRAGLTLPLADDPLGANGVDTAALLARRPRQARRTNEKETR